MPRFHGNDHVEFAEHLHGESFRAVIPEIDPEISSRNDSVGRRRQWRFDIQPGGVNSDRIAQRTTENLLGEAVGKRAAADVALADEKDRPRRPGKFGGSYPTAADFPEQILGVPLGAAGKHSYFGFIHGPSFSNTHGRERFLRIGGQFFICRSGDVGAVLRGEFLFAEALCVGDQRLEIKQQNTVLPGIVLDPAVGCQHVPVDVLLVARLAEHRPHPAGHRAAQVVLAADGHLGRENRFDSVRPGQPHHFRDALPGLGHGRIDAISVGPVDIVDEAPDDDRFRFQSENIILESLEHFKRLLPVDPLVDHPLASELLDRPGPHIGGPDDDHITAFGARTSGFLVPCIRKQFLPLGATFHKLLSSFVDVRFDRRVAG